MKRIFVDIIGVVLIVIIVFKLIDNNNITRKSISYNGNNLRISIDGETSNTLPTSGIYYLVNYECNNINTKVIWDKENYKLNVSNVKKDGSVSCYLNFKSKPLLSEMKAGSYVAYTGNNGCDSENIVDGYSSCSGKNDNYVSYDDMGYCDNPSFKFRANGWKISYVENNIAYLISAGAPECVSTYVDSESKSKNSVDLSTNYYYGSGYSFDVLTGIFSLIGVTENTLVWSEDYSGIIANYPYTCKSTSSTGTCSTLYEVISYNNSTFGNAYTHFNYEITYGIPLILANLDNKSLKYCNNNYMFDGVCNNTTAWAMNDIDVEKISGPLKVWANYRYYNSELINNGGQYFIAKNFSNSSIQIYGWEPVKSRMEVFDASTAKKGVRPILKLDSSVVVTGGSGTYEDPYTIANNSFSINNGVRYIGSNDNLSVVSLDMNKAFDVSTMCVSVDTSVCTNYVAYSDTYTLDWSGSSDGERIVYVYYKDSSGEIVASINRSIIIDTVTPTDNSISISEGTTVDRTLTLASTGADYMCFSNTSNSASDCTNWVDYATTYSWSLTSGDGEKTVYAFFKDEAGNVSNSVSATTTVSGSTSE